MKRKDCDNSTPAEWRSGVPRLSRGRWGIVVVTAVGAMTAPLSAGMVRLRTTSVVVEDTVHLADVAELKGFDHNAERILADLTIAESPPPGGSRVLHLDLIRTALSNNGANMATVVLTGAIQCTVLRPSAVVDTRPTNDIGGVTRGDDRRSLGKDGAGGNRPRSSSGAGKSSYPPARCSLTQPSAAPDSKPTLREAVIGFFQRELDRFGGGAEVTFDRTSEQVLELSEPTYHFRVRPKGSTIGLTQLDVEVSNDGRAVQTIPMVVQVSMTRRVVLAKRAINQNATIQPADVEFAPLSFTRLDKLGIADANQVIGQRCKRYLPAGTMIELPMLESVPLVTRGQIVTVIAVSGAVQVVTTGKATRDGLLAETVTVRASDREKLEFEAVVVGPGVVRIGDVFQKPVEQPAATGEGERVARRDET